MIFVMKDALRQSVEAASGGLCTVMYTRKGQPVFMRRIPKFRLEALHPSLGTGVHPAFLVGSREISEFWMGMYPAYVSNNELVSWPGVVPSTRTYNDWISLAQANGPGWHVVTAAEWAAIALSVVHTNNNTDPVLGNINGYGTDGQGGYGCRADNRPAGDTSAYSLTLTGSGPLSWRHDGSPFGIADMVCPWFATGYLLTGALLVEGEIRIVPNNNAAMNIDLSPTSPEWRAILPDGTLVAPGTSKSLKYDIPSGASYSNDNVVQNLGIPILKTTRTTSPWDGTDAQQDYAAAFQYSQVTRDSNITTVPNILHALGLYPHISTINRGFVAVRPYGIRPLRSGLYGLFGFRFYEGRGFLSPTFIAYIE